MMQRTLQAGIAVFVFFLFFEIIAVLSQSSVVRPKSSLAPLSLTKLDQTLVFSDELGTNSDIYRGQPIRIAAFGTSFTMGIETPKQSNWTRLLQASRPEVHVQNFSMMGSWEAFLANIEKAKATGVKYDYIFLSLTLTKGKRSTVSTDDQMIFRHSSRFRTHAGFPVSLNLLHKILSPFKPFSKLSPFASAQAQVRSLFDLKDTVPMIETNPMNDCYVRAMLQRQCREQFEIELAKTGRPPKDVFDDTYLTCQAEADRSCRVPTRVDFVPHFEVNQIASYREQINLLLELVQPLGGRIVLVSQGLFSQPNSPVLYQMLARNNPATLGFGVKDTDAAIAMTTVASWQRAIIRNNEIRQAARELKAEGAAFDFLDFEDVVNSEENVPAFFYDYAHLSPEGHSLYAKFFADRLGL